MITATMISVTNPKVPTVLPATSGVWFLDSGNKKGKRWGINVIIYMKANILTVNFKKVNLLFVILKWLHFVCNITTEKNDIIQWCRIS